VDVADEADPEQRARLVRDAAVAGAQDDAQVNMNRGIFMTPGREEEWTLSVTHDDEAVDQYVQVFDAMAEELTR
jgi:glutamate-1-semialdehyde aminotransferase